MSGMTEVSSLTGRLLVATPALADPNFDRAVVLLLDHDEEGSLGVVLNRATENEHKSNYDYYQYYGPTTLPAVRR